MTELPNTGAMLLQTLLALAVVVFAIWAAAWLLRRLQNPVTRRGPLRVIAETPLGMRERAVLLQVGERQVLIGVAQGRVSRLMELDTPVEVPTPAHGEGFGALLTRLKGGAR